MIALCNFLCCPEVDIHSIELGGRTNVNSWYSRGMECNRVKFPKSGIATALGFREGQFNSHPGEDTFTAIFRKFCNLEGTGQLPNN